MQHDFLKVDAGLYGAVFAHELTPKREKCLVIDRRSHFAGNAYKETISGIHVHQYGAHVSHTNAVVYYPTRDVLYTRTIEHQLFGFGTQPTTIIGREYSAEQKPSKGPDYVVNKEQTAAFYARYKVLADKRTDVILGGRLGRFKYYNMDKVTRKM